MTEENQKRIERKLEQIDDKLNILLAEKGIKGYREVKINPVIRKIEIPANVELDAYEKQIAKDIYTADHYGITSMQISRNTGIERRTVSLIIAGLMSKGIPIQSTKGVNRRYRFEKLVMEKQAKNNFLGF